MSHCEPGYIVQPNEAWLECEHREVKSNILLHSADYVPAHHALLIQPTRLIAVLSASMSSICCLRNSVDLTPALGPTSTPKVNPKRISFARASSSFTIEFDPESTSRPSITIWRLIYRTFLRGDQRRFKLRLRQPQPQTSLEDVLNPLPTANDTFRYTFEKPVILFHSPGIQSCLKVTVRRFHLLAQTPNNLSRFGQR